MSTLTTVVLEHLIILSQFIPVIFVPYSFTALLMHAVGLRVILVINLSCSQIRGTDL